MSRLALVLGIALILPLLFLSSLEQSLSRTSKEDDINKLIETATTPEEHMKIADYYEKEAARMEKRARFHASMADSYKKRSKPLIGLANHCLNLAKKYGEAAKEYKNMAMEHRRMAEEMQKMHQ